MKIFIVIPAYNEERTIGKVLDELKKYGYKEIVVVDDGSRDNTSKIVKGKKVHLVRHMVNRGQGAALETGNLYALKNNADIIVHFDADGQHNVFEISNLTKPIINKETDITLGSRFLKKQKMPFSKIVLLKGSIIINWIFTGVKLSDAHNGFRAFSREAAIKVRISSDKMEHASEIIEEIKKNNIKYKEIPVTINYTRYSMQKGQRITNSFNILSKLILKKLWG